MNNLFELLSFSLMGAALLLMLFGIVLAAIMPGIDRWSKRFFIILFIIHTLFICACFAELALYANPKASSAIRIAAYLESLPLTLPIPMYTVFLLHSSGESWRRNPLLRAVCALWAIYLLLVTVAQRFPFIYYYSADNLFYRGPLYWLLVVPIFAILMLNLTGLFHRKNKLSGKYFSALLVCHLPMTVATLVHIFVSVFAFIGFGIAISALSMFFLILTDQIDRYMCQQRQIAQQRAKITVLQMRPHFIYNTMMSIYYLCHQDPDMAQQVTLDFTTYLRKNFTAIASDHTIPFSEELEHTRAYLAVEHAQFEDSLFVEYDTPHTLFRLPPLTLQPIVENAVKHGMDPDADPLCISIQTRQTASGSEITVTDNGSGCSPSPSDEPHIALDNIRQRLEMMCQGSLSISQREGGGTVVRVLIP